MDDETPDEVTQQARTLQTIVGAMATSSLVFAGAALLLGSGENSESFLSRAAMITGLVAIAAHAPAGKSIRSNQQPGTNPLGAYTVGALVSAAILEGGILFNLIAHLLEKSNWNLAMAALLWVVLLTKMPTRSGIQEWLDHEERNRQDEEALG